MSLPGLPLELWRAIATLDAVTYFSLVQVARSFAIPNAMELMLRVETNDSKTTTRLPNGALHSVHDRPAVIMQDRQQWYRAGILHRTGAAAIVFIDGRQIWIENGKLRDDLPYCIQADGAQMWSDTANGCCAGAPLRSILEIHKAPMKSIDATGIVSWETNHKIHREWLPAIIYVDGTQQWCIHGELHREGLPAVINNGGTQYWAINGVLEGCDAIFNHRTEWLNDWHKRGLCLDIRTIDFV